LADKVGGRFHAVGTGAEPVGEARGELRPVVDPAALSRESREKPRPVAEPTTFAEEIGGKLRAIRERASLTQEAAAKAAGVSRVVLAYYETGRRQVPLTVATTLARLYGTSLEILLDDGERTHTDIDVSGVLARAAPCELSDQAKAGLRLFELRLGYYVDLATKMGKSLPGPGHSPLASPGIMTVKEAGGAARDLRRHLNFGGEAIPDLFQALEDHILIWRLPLGDDLEQVPSGLFYNHPRAGFCIAVNSRLTLDRQIFALAHELAHAYFHSGGASVVVSMAGTDQDRERFADVFASEFLVPGYELRRIAKEIALPRELVNPTTVIRLQRRFGVSFATLRARLLEEKMITQAGSDALEGASPRQLAATLGLPPVHPADLEEFDLHPLAAQPIRALILVREALAEEAITRGRAADILGTSTEEIRQLLGAKETDD
jgi:transcriptional regulator with XRE-family HTH domain